MLVEWCSKITDARILMEMGRVDLGRVVLVPISPEFVLSGAVLVVGRFCHGQIVQRHLVSRKYFEMTPSNWNYAFSINGAFTKCSFLLNNFSWWTCIYMILFMLFQERIFFNFIPNLLTSLLQRINKSNRFANFHYETRSDYDNMQTPVTSYADLDQQRGRK